MPQDGGQSGGMWTKSEAKNHISYLEMLTIFLGLQTFAKNLNNTHIRIMCDNTTLVTAVSRDTRPSQAKSLRAIVVFYI